MQVFTGHSVGGKESTAPSRANADELSLPLHYAPSSIRWQLAVNSAKTDQPTRQNMQAWIQTDRTAKRSGLQGSGHDVIQPALMPGLLALLSRRRHLCREGLLFTLTRASRSVGSVNDFALLIATANEDEQSEDEPNRVTHKLSMVEAHELGTCTDSRLLSVH